MSRMWIPDGWTLDVPNPGYGELIVVAEAHPAEGRPLVREDWVRTFDGAEIGEFLAGVTQRACQSDTAPATGTDVVPSFVTPQAARDLLPALQRAVVDAVAGGERYDRTFRDETEPPPVPYCVNCGEGTLYTPGACTSPWCEQYGHHAFGMGAETSWESAQRRHSGRVEQWEFNQRWAELTRPHRRPRAF